MNRKSLPSIAIAMSVLLAALVFSGCGNSNSSSNAQRTIEIAVAFPADGTTSRKDEVSVRGTVTPADATVQVAGTQVTVKDGAFEAVVRLNMGLNTIDVVATKTGRDPATKSLEVKRGRTKAQIAKARKTKEIRAAKRRAAKRRAEAAAKVPESPKPPAEEDACDPNYEGACIPTGVGDLNCPDVNGSNFTVVGTDIYGFDRDGDGIACES